MMESSPDVLHMRSLRIYSQCYKVLTKLDLDSSSPDLRDMWCYHPMLGARVPIVWGRLTRDFIHSAHTANWVRA